MRATSSVRAALLSLAVLVVGGCASVQPRQHFAEIEQSVSKRTQYRVHWNGESDADKEAAKEIDQLLSRPLTADAAVQVALLNNRNLQATYEELGVAEADLVEAGLLKNPIFDGSVRFLQGGGSPTVDLGIAFDFLDVFFVGLRKRVAAAEFDVAKANVTGAVLDLAAETKAGFFRHQAALQTLEMRRQVRAATAASFDLAKRIRAAGNNRPLDVANEQSLFEESRQALAAAELDVVETREELNRLMGLWGTRTAWTAAARLTTPEKPEGSSDSIERDAIAQSLDLAAQRSEILAALRTLGITKPLATLQEIEVGASAERDDGEWEVGPSLSVPLPIFNQGAPQIARAAARFRQAEQRFYATAVVVRSHARESFLRVKTLREQVDHYRMAILPLKQSIVDETQLQYNAMQVGAFQLLQAKREQIEAGAVYLDLLRDYWVARAELELLKSGRMKEIAERSSSTPARTTSSGSSSEGH